MSFPAPTSMCSHGPRMVLDGLVNAYWDSIGNALGGQRLARRADLEWMLWVPICRSRVSRGCRSRVSQTSITDRKQDVITGTHLARFCTSAREAANDRVDAAVELHAALTSFDHAGTGTETAIKEVHALVLKLIKAVVQLQTLSKTGMQTPRERPEAEDAYPTRQHPGKDRPGRRDAVPGKPLVRLECRRSGRFGALDCGEHTGGVRASRCVRPTGLCKARCSKRNEERTRGKQRRRLGTQFGATSRTPRLISE